MNEIELPVLCSKCLGDATNLTLVRDLKGQKCRLCTRPFATFSWRKRKQGPAELSRFCIECANRKNVCQSCYRNFDTGLPLSVHESASGVIINTAPQALKYAAEEARADKQQQTQTLEYQQRLAAQQSRLALEGTKVSNLGTIRATLLNNTFEGPINDQGTVLVVNIEPDTDIDAIKQLLNVSDLEWYPQARCAVATFGSAPRAKAAIASNTNKGIFIVEGVKMRLIWCSPLRILDSHRQIAALIQQYMRGKLN